MVIHTDYPCNPDNYQRRRAQPVSFLVYHYVGAAGGAEANARYYHNTPGIGASAHYFVDHAPGAQVWQSVAEGDTAWHCGRSDGKYKHPSCRNANSIGIEMCCHQRADGSWYIDEETMAAAAELGRDIMARHGIPLEHVVRHYDVTGKLCPKPMVYSVPWSAFKARLEVEEVTVYHWFEDMPDWARPSAEKAYRKGIIKADANGAVTVYEQNLQPLVWMDRLGLLD